jgi:hypothetical protein
MKFCIISAIITAIASIPVPAFALLCVPLVIAYVIFSIGLFFRGEIAKGFFVAALCPILPMLSVFGRAIIHS